MADADRSWTALRPPSADGDDSDNRSTQLGNSLSSSVPSSRCSSNGDGRRDDGYSDNFAYEFMFGEFGDISRELGIWRDDREDGEVQAVVAHLPVMSSLLRVRDAIETERVELARLAGSKRKPSATGDDDGTAGEPEIYCDTPTSRKLRQRQAVLWNIVAGWTRESVASELRRLLEVAETPLRSSLAHLSTSRPGAKVPVAAIFPSCEYDENALLAALPGSRLSQLPPQEVDDLRPFMCRRYIPANHPDADNAHYQTPQEGRMLRRLHPAFNVARTKQLIADLAVRGLRVGTFDIEFAVCRSGQIPQPLEFAAVSYDGEGKADEWHRIVHPGEIRRQDEYTASRLSICANEGKAGHAIPYENSWILSRDYDVIFDEARQRLLDDYETRIVLFKGNFSDLNALRWLATAAHVVRPAAGLLDCAWDECNFVEVGTFLEALGVSAAEVTAAAHEQGRAKAEDRCRYHKDAIERDVSGRFELGAHCALADARALHRFAQTALRLAGNTKE
jgi:hypothetical protein